MIRLKNLLLCVWRWVRIPLAIVTVVMVLFTMIAVEEVLYLCIPFDRHSEYYKYNYEYDSRTIGPKEGNLYAVVEWEGCWYSDCPKVTTVKLEGGASGAATVFIYTPTDAYDPVSGIHGIPFVHNPDILWLSPGELQIAVRRVERITSQLTEARGVKITYRIESVDRP